LRVLRERQIRVPEDMGIVGFDDFPPAIQADPQLTTISQPTIQQGMLAVETMLQIIENPDRPLRQVALPVELVVRASTR
jgi:DNA-binding LacI/PurR family transcriptional regulator